MTEIKYFRWTIYIFLAFLAAIVISIITCLVYAHYKEKRTNPRIVKPMASPPEETKKPSEIKDGEVKPE
jgi:hypothetical protein